MTTSTDNKAAPADQSHETLPPPTAAPTKTATKFRKLPTTKRRNRGLDEISPFLHRVDKIVTEEGAKHTSVDTMPWYTTWQTWKSMDLFNKISMNSITTVICPDIHYNQRTIKIVVERCVRDITPIGTYISITHLSDKSVIWSSRIDVASFKSIRGRKSRKMNTKIDTSKNDSPSINKNDNTSIDSRTSSRNSSLTSSRVTPTANPKLPSSIQLHPPTNTPPPTGNERSLTAQGYLDLKMTAIAEIIESTTKGLVVLNKATTTAVNTLNDDYEQILAEWDTTKAELYFETKVAITDLKNALDKTSQMKINQEIIQTNLSQTKLTINDLDSNLDDVIGKATTTATKVTMAAVNESTKKAIHDINYHSNQYLQNMDDVFNETMGLMHDQHAAYNICQLCKDAKNDSMKNIDADITAKANLALATLQEKTNDIISNVKHTFTQNTTIKDTRDGIIADIVQCKSNVKEEIVKLTQFMHTDKNKIISVLDKIKTAVQTQLRQSTAQMHDIRDGIITDTAEFSNKLNISTMALVDSKVRAAEDKLKTDMDSYVLTHTVTLQETFTTLRQDIRTKLFLELTLEKDCLKNELIAELQAEKQIIIQELHDTRTPPVQYTNKFQTTAAPANTNTNDFDEWRNATNGTDSNDTTGATQPDTSGDSMPAADHYGPNTYTSHPTTFMGYPIDMSGDGRHPILTPHQFQLSGQPVIEVDAHKL